MESAGVSRKDLVKSDGIGEFVEKPTEMRGEWRISNFFSLKTEVDVLYTSPTFFFSDSAWELQLYPNGRIIEKSEGSIGIFLKRLDCGSSRTVGFSIGIRKAYGEEHVLVKSEKSTFMKHGWGRENCLKRSEMLRRKTEMAPSGVVTVTCTLKSDADHSMEISLFSRLWNLSLNLKNIMIVQKRTDVTLKLKDGEIPAHRMILESRSTVFNRMFGVDMRETQTGEVNVEDGEEDVFKVVLSYTYSGDPEGLSTENTCDVYKVAHKYELQELRQLCAEFMQKNLSADSVCDIFAIGSLYQEKNLEVCAKNYFSLNKTEIFKSEKWEIFKAKNPISVIELLECALGRDG